ncbi:MAG: MBL fold metallo-hydrolase [Halioglobus sp.]
MNFLKLSKISAVCGLVIASAFPILANAEAEDYRFVREPGFTKDGYPLPLSGVPITKTPIIAKEGVTVKDYPEHYIPGTETLADNEMRVTACGTWGPAPMRIGQGASCILVELGNGDTFIFDIGGGTVGNLFALGVPPAELDKVFITHYHLDHIGGIFPLFDAMGWGRNTPLHLWGSTGETPELGITAISEHVVGAAAWHIQNKQSLLPKAGMKIIPHPIDYKKFSPENPRQIAYQENGVIIYAFPVVHALSGSMGYRLEWNGLTFVYTADSNATTFEAEQGKGADIFIHEIFPSAAEFAHYNHMPLEAGESVMTEHTTPAELGEVYNIAKPRLGVGSHFTLDDDLIDPLFKRWKSTYNEPTLLMQDLTTVNITADYIVTRQSRVDQLAWPAKPKRPPADADLSLGPVSKATPPKWLTDTKLNKN